VRRGAIERAPLFAEVYKLFTKRRLCNFKMETEKSAALRGNQP
jgi:hypothetical protein